MRNANTQTMPTIMVINDLIPSLTEPSREDVQQTLDSLFHWEFPEEDEPCGRLSLDTGGFFSQQTDEQEWREDYTASIRL
jgi:hypothetical protein